MLRLLQLKVFSLRLFGLIPSPEDASVLFPDVARTESWISETIWESKKPPQPSELETDKFCYSHSYLRITF